jgi:DNA-binding transcriptional regulator YiaG
MDTTKRDANERGRLEVIDAQIEEQIRAIREGLRVVRGELAALLERQQHEVERKK